MASTRLRHLVYLDDHRAAGIIGRGGLGRVGARLPRSPTQSGASSPTMHDLVQAGPAAERIPDRRVNHRLQAPRRTVGARVVEERLAQPPRVVSGNTGDAVIFSFSRKIGLVRGQQDEITGIVQLLEYSPRKPPRLQRPAARHGGTTRRSPQPAGGRISFSSAVETRARQCREPAP